MNRRDFLKRTLGIVGVGLLMGGTKQVEESAALTSTRIYPFVGRDDLPLHLDVSSRIGVPDHTHEITFHDLPQYGESPFALSEEIVTIRDVLYLYRGRGG